MQTKTQSAVEVAVNYVIGYALAWLITNYLLHWLGYPIRRGETTGVVLVFTAVSVARTYFVRRFFNWMHARDCQFCKGTGDIYWAVGDVPNRTAEKRTCSHCGGSGKERL